MITEQYKDKVYFSKLLRADYPVIYNNVCNILNENNVSHDTLSPTKDYWCRDYMPIQFSFGHFAQFVYSPDYLKGKDKYVTDAGKVIERLKNNNVHVRHSSLVVDGGNVVVCEAVDPNTNVPKPYLVMTDKVMKENPTLSKSEIEKQIKSAFAIEECTNMNDDLCIVWLPWDTEDVCGHTDGILRYVGTNKNGKPIVLTNLSVYGEDIANQMREILQKYFEVRELKLSEYDELSWAYINALQTRDILIVPGIDNEKLDKEVMKQIANIYPDYVGRIYQVQMKDLIQKWGGALNCCTWTVSNDLSKLPHNEVNDNKYTSLIEKYKNDVDSLTIGDIKFMGDYYPRNLWTISPMLEKIYYGF